MIAHIKSLSFLLLTFLFIIGEHAVAQNREILAEFKIGVIGRDSEDPAYQAVHNGAIDAARDLGKEYSIDIELRLLTPKLSEGQTQSAALGQLLIEGADGVVISPEPREDVTESLEFAIQNGQQVAVFESINPVKDALISIISDEAATGRLTGKAMSKLLPTRGRVAILTAKQPSPEIQARLDGLRESLGYRSIEQIVACEPDYDNAIKTIRQAVKRDRNHRIKGWVFLDDWPLLGSPALPWSPGKLPCVAVQSTPAAFIYLENKYLSSIVAHPYYEWGYLSVKTLIEALYLGQTPEENPLILETRLIDRNNAEQYRQDWKQWLN